MRISDFLFVVWFLPKLVFCGYPISDPYAGLGVNGKILPYNLIDTNPTCFWNGICPMFYPGGELSVFPNSEERFQHILHNMHRLFLNQSLSTSLGYYYYGTHGEKSNFVRGDYCGEYVKGRTPLYWYSEANQAARWKQYDEHTCDQSWYSEAGNDNHVTCKWGINNPSFTYKGTSYSVESDRCSYFGDNCGYGMRVAAFCNDDNKFTDRCMFESEGLCAGNSCLSSSTHCDPIFADKYEYFGKGFVGGMNGVCSVYSRYTKEIFYPLVIAAHFDERTKVHPDMLQTDGKHFGLWLEYHDANKTQTADACYALYNGSITEMSVLVSGAPLDGNSRDSYKEGFYSAQSYNALFLDYFTPPTDRCEPYAFMCRTSLANVFRLPEDSEYYFGTEFIDWKWSNYSADYGLYCKENHYYYHSREGWTVNGGPTLNKSDIWYYEEGNQCIGCDNIQILDCLSSCVYNFVGAEFRSCQCDCDRTQCECAPVTDYKAKFLGVSSYHKQEEDEYVQNALQLFLNETSDCEYDESEGYELEFWYRVNYKEVLQRLIVNIHACCGKSKQFGISYSVPVDINNYADYVANDAWKTHNAITDTPTSDPTYEPTKTPSQNPTQTTQNPSQTPTQTTQNPTQTPTQNPTLNPTFNPSQKPTITPTQNPTNNPTQTPSKDSKHPTLAPTQNPSLLPTLSPTQIPTTKPTNLPTKNPSQIPTIYTTRAPSANPTLFPTNNPIANPTYNPSLSPIVATTASPTFKPTNNPILNPTKNPTRNPTKNPSLSTRKPSALPSIHPTKHPNALPAGNPTKYPTINPTKSPTKIPTSSPSNAVKSSTQNPVFSPTISPSKDPTISPSKDPTISPSKDPTISPTKTLTSNPTKIQTADPTKILSTNNPHIAHTANPSLSPTSKPTALPSTHPIINPTKHPTISPTQIPTASPSFNPTQISTANPLKSTTENPTSAAPTKTITSNSVLTHSTKILSTNPTFNPHITHTANPSKHLYTLNPTISPSISITTECTIMNYKAQFYDIMSYNAATEEAIYVEKGRLSFINDTSDCIHVIESEPSLEFFYRATFTSSKSEVIVFMHVCCGNNKRFSDTYKLPASIAKYNEYKPNQVYLNHHNIDTNIEENQWINPKLWMNPKLFGVKQYAVFTAMGLMFIGCLIGCIFVVKRCNKKKDLMTFSKTDTMDIELADTIEMHATQSIRSTGEYSYMLKAPTMQLLGHSSAAHNVVPSISVDDTPAEEISQRLDVLLKKYQNELDQLNV